MSIASDAVNHTALGWVKPELDETLRQARQEVEYFLDAGGAITRMEACAARLHQVHGILRMVELYAPALVAQELEALAAAVGSGDVEDREDACATLMRGTVLLPDYLERLQGGHRDVPVVLMPLLNDVRMARGAPGLDESVLFAFAPDSTSASETEIDHARGSVSGRNRALLDTVGTAVKEEMLRIKEALDLHLRTAAPHQALQAQVQELGEVADTLAMMGLGSASNIVQQQRDTLAAVASGQQPVAEDLLLEVAGALLFVDAALDDQVAQLGMRSAATAASQESLQTVAVVAQEALANFAVVRERLEAFIETGWQHEALVGVPQLFAEVAGALRMLELDVAADHVDAVGAFVEVELLQQRRAPARQMDTLADAVASLEYYLEVLRDHGSHREQILETTRDSLEALRYWPQRGAAVEPPSTRVQPVQREAIVATWAADPAPARVVVSPAVPARVEAPRPPLAGLTFDPLPPATASIDAAADAATLFDPVQAEQATTTPAASDTAFRAALDAAIAAFDPPLAAETLPDASTALAGRPSPHTAEAGETLVDDGIRAVFLEELAENQQMLDSLLPAWLAHPQALEHLRPVSRVFHSLKGSGRLVGADRLSAFAQAIEQALAPTLAGTQPVSPALVALLQHAQRLLPGFHAALAGEGPPLVEADAVQLLAGRIVRGEEAYLEDRADGQDPQAVGKAGDSLEAAQGVPAQIDEVLREILQAEVDTHRVTLQHWLQQAAQAPRIPDEGVVRAVHTMSGAFGMTDVPVMPQLMGAAESWLKRAMLAGVAADAEVLDAFEAMVQRMDVAMQALYDDAPVIASEQALTARLLALADALPEAAWPPHIDDDGVAPAADSVGEDYDGDAEDLADEDSEEDETHALTSAEGGLQAFGDPVTLQQALDEGLHVVDGETPLDALDTSLSLATVPGQHAADAVTDAHAVNGPIDASTDAVASDLDEELVAIFVGEADELLDHSAPLLERLRTVPADRLALEGLQRHLHTLKGSARMAGAQALGDLCHGIESLLDAVAVAPARLQATDSQLLARAYDRLQQMVGLVRLHVPVTAADDLLDALQQRVHTMLGAPVPLTQVEIPLAPLSPALALDEGDAAPGARHHEVRVRAGLLDRLVDKAGEVLVLRSRLAQQMDAFRGALGELERTNARLQDQVRRLDLETEAQIVARYEREEDSAQAPFDPLELDRFSSVQALSRALGESAADLGGLQAALDDVARQYESLLQQQARVSSELGDGLARARRVSLDSVLPRLERVLRQAGDDAGKQVQLQVEDNHGDLDRNVLDRLVAPLEHLLRNAVAHGLEAPAQRQAAAKPAHGTVLLRLERQGTEMVLEVADDGAGLDHEAIRERAVQRGLLAADAVPSTHELDGLVFASGLSTAPQVSALAGRGVGLDVVSSEVGQLGGSIDVQSSRGAGTRFIIHLPQRLNVAQSLFVRVGETVHAVPVVSVTGVGEISRERLLQGGSYHYGGQDHALHALGDLLGQPPSSVPAPASVQVPLLLVQAGELHAAVAVDEILGQGEVLVKAVAPQLTSVPGILGATLGAEGSVMLVLDIAPLVRNRPKAREAGGHVPLPATVPRILVVDDSLTMRKVTSRLLERHGLAVDTARDGVQALENLQARLPAMVLLDVEMPRMDGYELVAAMRDDPRMVAVPVVMITSRSGEKHRQRALALGVQHYLGKPYQEAELMRIVQALLGERDGHE